MNLSRRTLLRLAGAAPLAAARGETPLYALCMDTHDAKKRNLAEQAEMLRELGYAGAGHLWFDQVAERLATLDRAGLKLFQIYMRIDLGPKAAAPYDARLREVLPLLKGRGTQLAPLIVGGPPSDRAFDDRAAAVVREIASLAAPYGVQVAIYPHQKNLVETVEDGLRIAAKSGSPNAGVMLNLCHWLKVGEERELRPMLAAAGRRLIAVSINGCDRGAEIKAGTGKWIEPLDTGAFDLAAFLTELRKAGYDGAIGLQCWGIPGDAAVHLRRSMTAWKELQRRVQSAG